MDAKKTKAVAPSKESTASENIQPAQFTLPLWPESTKPRTKKSRILETLRAGKTLNCFDARAYGDSCLHSTVSALRNDGYLIAGEWESVPTKWGALARVLRYSYVGIKPPGNPFAELLGRPA
ncbi:helix-turn-helix domain-containing protein [Paraburkholderia tropica]|uniref:helix-turn-helix domain-containing protein n=1 Tax=Paraburkholderia tropica TaxID=92647 RepID=UPI002AB777A9|nr:helix-turn-helix domain-containing protein [Paraburkholderia tropica]